MMWHAQEGKKILRHAVVDAVLSAVPALTVVQPSITMEDMHAGVYRVSFRLVLAGGTRLETDEPVTWLTWQGMHVLLDQVRDRARQLVARHAPTPADYRLASLKREVV